jgi:WD40 repeat protein
LISAGEAVLGGSKLNGSMMKAGASMKKGESAEEANRQTKTAAGAGGGTMKTSTIAGGGELKKKVKQVNGFEKIEKGIYSIEKQIHKGWITKIKFYPDLNYIVTSSLDGFIHIHDIEDLSYKENKTFNLHQKGVNSFVYSAKHRFIASCGEERHIIMWDPFTLGALSHLYGHNTSV